MADFLSQEEVDLLLSAVSEGELETGVAADSAESKAHLTAYDFRRPERVSKEQLRGLQSLFEGFARELSIMLPGYLRTISRVDLTSIDQLTYDEFILSVARPTSLNIIKMSPLEGFAILEFNPTLVFPIVDRLLGGKGTTLSDPRELTEIEERIFQRIIFMALDSLTRSWSHLVEFDLKIHAQENNPLIVQIVQGSEMVILVSFEVHVGEIIGPMNLAIPLVVLNPVLERIGAHSRFVPTMSKRAVVRNQEKIKTVLSCIKVPLEVYLGDARIQVKELVRLQPGDIIQLEQGVKSPVSVRVEKQAKLWAKPGRVGSRNAVQIIAFDERKA